MSIELLKKLLGVFKTVITLTIGILGLIFR